MNGPSEARRLGAIVVATVTATTLAVSYVAHSALPHNPIVLPYSKVPSVRAVAPEGWKFFTRNPREERLIVLMRDGKGWRDATAGVNGSPVHLFGLRRTTRAQSVEIGDIVRQIGGNVWQDCATAPARCAYGEPSWATNASPTPTVCGELLFVLQKPVPWAWAHEFGGVTMPSRVARTLVQCSP